MKQRKHYFIVTCSHGFETILQQELRKLNLNNVTIGTGMARFQGTLRDGYKASVWTRLGSRVLLELSRFEGNNADELYDGIQKIPWEEHLDAEDSLWIDFTGYSKDLRHSQFAARRAKDAIVDRFRDKFGVRPSVDKDGDIRIHIHLQHALFVVSLDLCGTPLHHRTPNKRITDAPLKETLAAALLHHSGWVKQVSKGVDLLDPMCGSGSIAIEAMGIACNKAGNLDREDWLCFRWKQHNPSLWEDVITEANDAKLSKPMATIHASDMDATAIEYVKFNCKQQNLPKIHTTVSPIKRLQKMADTGFLVTNPPYGERIGSHAYLDEIYTDIGTLFHTLPEWRYFLLCPPNELYQKTGFVRKGERVTLYNGPLKCRFLELQLPVENQTETISEEDSSDFIEQISDEQS